MRERQLIEAIYKRYPDSILFRNDNGTAWAGGKTTKRGDKLILAGARRVRYGLQPGSADMIGWTPVVITPEMVGETVAVFTSVEAKTHNDRLRENQIRWFNNVRDSGGLARVIWENGSGELVEINPLLIR